MDTVDVWVLRFDAPDSPALIEGLMRVFKLDEHRARSLAHGTPRVVKRNVASDVGEKFRGALTALGAQVELRPTRGDVVPGKSPLPPRPSDPVPGGPPMSLAPASFDEPVVFESPRPPARGLSFDDGGPTEWLSNPAEDAASGGAGRSDAGDFQPAVTVAVQRVPRHSLPPGALTSTPPHAAKAKKKRDARLELISPFERSIPAMGAIVLGVVLLGVGLALDRSSFRGSAGIGALVSDGLALVALAMGITKLVRVHFFYGEPHLDLRVPGALFLPCMFVAYLVNGYVEEARGAPPETVEEQNEVLEEAFGRGLAVSEVLGDPAVRFPGFDRADVEELVAGIEDTGARARFARPVDRGDERECDALYVELPADASARATIEQAYQRFLGLRVHELAEEEVSFDPHLTHARLIVGWSR